MNQINRGVKHLANTVFLLFLSIGIQVSPWRGAGLAVPVFSLRSNEDVGVGEFLDIKLLVDFSIKCGLHLIQLLPVNDTSVNGMWWDSYPYRYADEVCFLYLNLFISRFHCSTLTFGTLPFSFISKRL